MQESYELSSVAVVGGGVAPPEPGREPVAAGELDWTSRRGHERRSRREVGALPELNRTKRAVEVRTSASRPRLGVRCWEGSSVGK